MRLLGLRAYWKLLQFEVYLARGNFHALYDRVRRHRMRPPAFAGTTAERICSAVDMACIWYWKPVHCLQRSAATACLLRDAGIQGQLVIGAQPMPFKAHAWVEVEGHVVNDKSYMRERYAILDRC